MTLGFSTNTGVATSISRPAVVRGRTAGRPTECLRSSKIAALLIIWTTGAHRAGTNGPTGITRCGNTSARTTKELFASLGSLTMAKKVTGGCACGSIRYQLLDKPTFVHCCHCDDCQRLTGSAFVLNAIIETRAIKLLSLIHI